MTASPCMSPNLQITRCFMISCLLELVGKRCTHEKRQFRGSNRLKVWKNNPKKTSMPELLRCWGYHATLVCLRQSVASWLPIALSTCLLGMLYRCSVYIPVFLAFCRWRNNNTPTASQATHPFAKWANTNTKNTAFILTTNALGLFFFLHPNRMLPVLG